MHGYDNAYRHRKRKTTHDVDMHRRDGDEDDDADGVYVQMALHGDQDEDMPVTRVGNLLAIKDKDAEDDVGCDDDDGDIGNDDYVYIKKRSPLKSYTTPWCGSRPTSSR